MDSTSDVIIVGAGNAGCALAKLLARKYSVTVLEAGYDQSDDPDIVIPSRSGTLVLNRTNRYFYPLGHATGPSSISTDRLPGVAGEIVGGGSSINGMQIVRGTAQFYDQIAAGVYDPAWDAAHASQIYRELETFNGVTAYDPAAHGHSGPVDIRQSVLNLQAASVFTDAVIAEQTISFPSFPAGLVDYNSFTTPLGAYQYWQVTQTSTPTHERESSYTAYLKAGLVQSRRNCNLYEAVDTCCPLQLWVRARFQQLHWAPCTSKARVEGVTVAIEGVCQTFWARKYVILCTGFQTSAFLQTAGIGDGPYLKSLGIDVIVHNPNVGQHMINHPIIALTGLVPEGGPNPFDLLPGTYDREGLYSGGAQLPDAEGRRGFQMIGITSPNIPGQAPTAFTIASLILEAESKGEIRIFDRDPNRIPEFTFNYFSAPADVAKGVDIYTRSYNVLVRMGLVPLGPDPVSDPAGVETYVKTRFSQAYHWVGMNRMTSSRATGVVDSNGRVFGTQNLLIGDISIVPQNPMGNTQAIAYWVANVLAKKLNCKRSHH